MSAENPIGQEEPKQERITRDDYYITLIGARDFWINEHDKIMGAMLQAQQQMMQIEKNLALLNRAATQEQEAVRLGLKVEYFRNPENGTVITHISGKKPFGFETK